MEEDYLYSSDEQIIKLVQTILGLESIEMVAERLKKLRTKTIIKYFLFLEIGLTYKKI